MCSKSESHELCEKSSCKSNVELRDLEGLLRKSLGNELTLLKSEVKNLLSKGENFASTLLKVSAKIKRSKDAPIEDLELVAKMVPATEYQKRHFKFEVSFLKEIFVLESLIPTYRELQKEIGFDDSELLDITPKVYGSRLSLKPENELVDEDVTFLMENLQIAGFKTMNRKKGLDYQHAKLALTELAKYHALGIVCKHRKPEFFEFAKSKLKAKMITSDDGFGKITNRFREILCSDPRVARYEDYVKKSFSQGWEGLMTRRSTDNIWTTFNHGDFWVNNIMYRHDESGKPVQVKFVDFQMPNFNAGLRDLPYFLNTSCQNEVIANQYDEMLSIYLEVFVETLKKCGLDASEYTREKFDQQLKMEQSGMLLSIATAMKFMTLDEDQEFDLNKLVSVMLSENNEFYKDKVYLLVKTFVERDWA